MIVQCSPLAHSIQAYPFFWDKLNKCNYFLELAIDTADLPLDDRVVTHLNNEVISDGGQWDMAVNLLEVWQSILLFLNCPDACLDLWYGPATHLS